MAFGVLADESGLVSRIRAFFRPRDIFVHDGGGMRRIHISVRQQVLGAAALGLAALSGLSGVAGMAINAPGVMSSFNNYAERQAELSRMETRVAALQAEVTKIRADATAHAERLEKRQAFLASVLQGEDDPKKLAALLPMTVSYRTGASQSVLASFQPIDAQQTRLASAVRAATEARYAETLASLRKLGLDPRMVSSGGMGGPYEPVATVAAPAVKGPAQPDPQFRALFHSWKKLDQLQEGVIAIPSIKPVNNVTINSGFGVRSDPFRGGAAMHSGVDIPGPIGTPIYATADGVVDRAGWVGGYGNMVELGHGRGIQTRYGHLSSIMVSAGTRVKRGQLVGLMGSTGRSTGSHLHYEVRLDGTAVNPMPFLRSTDYLVAMQKRNAAVALGGPDKAE
jgi:murein DD-endopeptidase MepM/ murein hydrolase activator NlpD